MIRRALISLLMPASAFSADYSEALDKARQAALIQSGIQSKIDKTKHQVEAFGIAQAEKFGVDKPLGVVLFFGKAYRDQAINLPIGQAERLTIKPDRAEIRIEF